MKYPKLVRPLIALEGSYGQFTGIFVKHDLKGVLKFIRLKIWTPSPHRRDRILSNGSSQTWQKFYQRMITDVTDIQAIIFLNPLRTEFFLIEKNILQVKHSMLDRNLLPWCYNKYIFFFFSQANAFHCQN